MKQSDSKSSAAPDRAALMTVRQLAEFLQCSRRHIDRLRGEGLPAIRVGGLVRFAEKDVLEWLEFQRRGSFGGYFRGG